MSKLVLSTNEQIANTFYSERRETAYSRLAQLKDMAYPIADYLSEQTLDAAEFEYLLASIRYRWYYGPEAVGDA